MCSYVAERFRCIFGWFPEICEGSLRGRRLRGHFHLSSLHHRGIHRWRWGMMGYFRRVPNSFQQERHHLMSFDHLHVCSNLGVPKVGDVHTEKTKNVGPTGLRFWPMAASPSHISEDHHGTHQHLPVWVQSWNSHRILMNFGQLVILEKKSWTINSPPGIKHGNGKPSAVQGFLG